MKNKNIIIGGVILVIIILIIVNPFKSKEPGVYDDFAKCLTEKGVKMYGTEWCPHCKDQKALFGKSFDFIDYIGCDGNKETCLIEGITGYPTWKINSESYPGVQPLEVLSELTGCEL